MKKAAYAIVGPSPDVLLNLLALANFMRFSFASSDELGCKSCRDKTVEIPYLVKDGRDMGRPSLSREQINDRWSITVSCGEYLRDLPKAVEENRFRPMYAGANMGHPFSSRCGALP
jgi:hypothetical protein